MKLEWIKQANTETLGIALLDQINKISNSLESLVKRLATLEGSKKPLKIPLNLYWS